MDQREPLSEAAYQQALDREQRCFESCLNVHDLPDIFHYWSQRHLRPKLRVFGLESADDLFSRYLKEICHREPNRPKRFVSAGSGNCELEIKLAHELRAAGHDGFVIDCVDLNPAMLDRGRAGAAKAGVTHNLEFTEADLNRWSPARDCDAMLANQSLHHVLNLEGLFEQVTRSLRPGGRFIIYDMIGRNGHQRWPEALAIIDEFWRKLPPSRRFNTRSKRYEERFEDWDCSVEGFEGIRAQDILPLLLGTFHFQFFLPFSNIIDPFVDRSFGPNFDATAEWDRAFIDEVHRRDEEEIFAGTLTPTHMLAVVVNEAQAGVQHPERLSPEFCVRRPSGPNISGNDGGRERLQNPYAWMAWPHSAEAELSIACKWLAQSARLLASQEGEIEKRTLWALDLQQQLEDQTRWMQESTLALQSNLESRTEWSLRLNKELEEKDRALAALQRELHEIRPLGYLKCTILTRVLRAVSRRLRRVLQAQSERH